MCMNVFPASMYVYHVYAGCLRKSEEGFESIGTDEDGCESPCRW